MIFTVFLIPLVILIWRVNEAEGSDARLSGQLFFTIRGGGYREDISVWSEDGENYYAFFPSYAGLSDVSLRLNGSSELFLNGQLLTEDYDLSALELETPYQLRYSADGAVRTARLTFLQSANVAAMYIHTASGSMDQIHADKAHKENAGIVLVDAGGHVDYAGGGNDKIKGRGNGSWTRDNKPYILQLSGANAMLGMAPAKKWILLSSSLDVSNIRNKLVYDFAEQTNLYWTPDCEYVDLYLNGEYAGLYLLTEKIEISEARLDLNENAYLFALETAVAPDNLGDHFSTESGQKIEISNPAHLTDQEIDGFHTYIQSVENAILSGSGGLFDKIDLDSWVRKYLIEEIFINLDAGLNSQYFYLDEGLSAKIFAGPIWDYDNTLGNKPWLAIQNPACFYASKAQHSPVSNTPWYAALYHNEIFYQRLVEIYQSEYLPLLDDLIDHGISALSDRIERAAVNNNIRWASLLKGRESYQEDVQYIQTFLKERVGFLNSAWIDGIPYCTIQLCPTETGRYLFFDVESGKTADLLPAPRELGASDSAVWYIDGTDTVFDVTGPVTGDLVLCAQTASELEAEARAKAEAEENERLMAEAEAGRPLPVKILIKIKNNAKIVVPFGALFVLMLAMLTVDWKRNQRRGDKAHGRHGRTDVSS